jgi:hypothetical protein
MRRTLSARSSSESSHPWPPARATDVTSLPEPSTRLTVRHAGTDTAQCRHSHRHGEQNGRNGRQQEGSTTENAVDDSHQTTAAGRGHTGIDATVSGPMTSCRRRPVPTDTEKEHIDAKARHEGRKAIQQHALHDASSSG